MGFLNTHKLEYDEGIMKMCGVATIALHAAGVLDNPEDFSRTDNCERSISPRPELIQNKRTNVNFEDYMKYYFQENMSG